MGGLEKQSRFLLVAIGFFVYGILTSALVYSQFEAMMPKIVGGVFGGIVVPESKAETAANIITRNAAATLLLIITGVTVAIPFLIVYFNGFFTGLILRYVAERGLSAAVILKGTLPHAIIELAAFFWAASLGFIVGLSVVNGFLKRDYGGVKTTLEGALLVYAKRILPLIIVAGVIETYVSAALIGAV